MGESRVAEQWPGARLHCRRHGSSVVQTGESGGEGVWETHRPESPPSHPLPQPLSKGRKPKALTQKTLACLPPQ